MTTHRLELVLVEVPSQVEGTTYVNWFNAISVQSVSRKDGLLEVIFSDGTIKVFNEDDSDDIIHGCSEILQRAIWKENPIPGALAEELTGDE